MTATPPLRGQLDVTAARIALAARMSTVTLSVIGQAVPNQATSITIFDLLTERSGLGL